MQQDITAGVQRSYRDFLLRLLIAAGVIVMVLALWQVREALMVAFAAVIVAVILLAAANPLRRLTGLSHGLAVAFVVTAICLALISLGWLLGAQITSQVSQLLGQLPQGIAALQRYTGISGPEVNEQVSGNGSLISGLLSRLAAWGYTLVYAVTGLILTLVAGVFLSLRPETYQRGLVKLLPSQFRQQGQEGLLECGQVLRLWLLGQLISMAIVGTLVGLGSWAIGLPSPIALGLIAAIGEFVPMVGPIFASIPALLLALSQGLSTVLWTLLLFIAIQQMESNIIMPQIQREMVRIPPALFLFSVLSFGILFGLLGVVLAAPLTVVAYFGVKRFYLGETL